MRTRRLVIRFDAPTTAGSRSGRGGGAGDREPGGPGAPDRPRPHDRCGVRAGTGARGRRAGLPDRGDGDHRRGAGRHPAHGHRLRSAGPLVRRQRTEVRVIATDQYTATRLTLQPSTAGSSGVTSTEAVTQRDVGVRSWTTSRRVLDVASGPAALLVLPENANAGWRATLGGRELTPLRVDGWMQGYLLPAGDGGRVTLEFTPNRLYQAGLGLGGLLALLLVAAAVVVGRREKRSSPLLVRRPAGHDRHGPSTPLGVALASARPGGRCPAGRAGLRGRTGGRRPGAAPDR